VPAPTALRLAQRQACLVSAPRQAPPRHPAVRPTPSLPPPSSGIQLRAQSRPVQGTLRPLNPLADALDKLGAWRAGPSMAQSPACQGGARARGLRATRRQGAARGAGRGAGGAQGSRGASPSRLRQRHDVVQWWSGACASPAPPARPRSGPLPRTLTRPLAQAADSDPGPRQACPDRARAPARGKEEARPRLARGGGAIHLTRRSPPTRSLSCAEPCASRQTRRDEELPRESLHGPERRSRPSRPYSVSPPPSRHPILRGRLSSTARGACRDPRRSAQIRSNRTVVPARHRRGLRPRGRGARGGATMAALATTTALASRACARAPRPTQRPRNSLQSEIQRGRAHQPASRALQARGMALAAPCGAHTTGPREGNGWAPTGPGASGWQRHVSLHRKHHRHVAEGNGGRASASASSSGASRAGKRRQPGHRHSHGETTYITCTGENVRASTESW